MNGNGAVPRSIRVERELAEWFDKQFPWRGSFPQFVNAALSHFKQEWGDRETSDEVLLRAMQRLGSKY